MKRLDPELLVRPPKIIEFTSDEADTLRDALEKYLRWPAKGVNWTFDEPEFTIISEFYDLLAKE